MKLNKNLIINISFALSLLILTLIVYIITLSRSVYFGDSGEFIAVAKTLGIAHPPGYPLYTMLAHLFTYLPFGNLPFKVNLFSAVTSSLTVVVVYFICLKLTKNRLAAVSASLFLAFSYLFWLYSLVAEVFSLNNLFVALIILISLHIFENPQGKKLFYLLAFVFGLALTNHHTILFLTPALIFLVLATNPKLLTQPKFLLPASFFFLLGLLPYIYLPVRASQNPVLTWGDPDTVGKFLHHILRRDYGTFSFGAGAKPNPFNFDVLNFYFSSLFSHFAAVGSLLAFVGLIFSFKEKKGFFYLLLAYLFLGAIFVFLSRLPIVGNIDAQGAIERFFLASEVILAIWIGLGLAKIIEKLPKILKLTQIPLAFLFLIPLLFNFQKTNQSQNFIYEDFGTKTFEILPQDSVVFVFGDRLSMIAKYLQIVKTERPDLKIINITFLTDDWYKTYIRKHYPDLPIPYEKFQYLKLSEVEVGEIICQSLLSKYPVFIENRTKGFDPASNKYCMNVLYKNFWKLEPKEYRISAEDLVEIDEYNNFWRPQIESLTTKKPYDLRTRAILLHSIAQPLTNLGFKIVNNFGKIDEAHEIYQDAFAISPDNAVALYLSARKSLREKDFETAEKIEKQTIQINPTLDEPYKQLGLIFFKVKNDKKTALSYFKKYLKYADENQEKNQIRKLVENLEKTQ